MPDYVVSKVMEALNEHGKHVKGSKILILGLAYKANVDDDRESPSYRLMEKLEHLGAEVAYNDPCIPVIRPSREYAKYAGGDRPDLRGFDLISSHPPHEYREIDYPPRVPGWDTRKSCGRGAVSSAGRRAIPSPVLHPPLQPSSFASDLR
jgi:UDP-N-acetyl-D-glucosamine dehydrogenase